MEFLTLNNGILCPAVGIGTFMLTPAEAENTNNVLLALISSSFASASTVSLLPSKLK